MTRADLDALAALEREATPAPWHFFHCDDWMAMNAYGVCTGEGSPDWSQGWPEENHERIVCMTLYQAQRVACHDAGKWADDARLIAETRNQLGGLLAQLRAARLVVQAARDALVGARLPALRDALAAFDASVPQDPPSSAP